MRTDELKYSATVKDRLVTIDFDSIPDCPLICNSDSIVIDNYTKNVNKLVQKTSNGIVTMYLRPLRDLEEAKRIVIEFDSQKEALEKLLVIEDCLHDYSKDVIIRSRYKTDKDRSDSN